MLELTNKDRKIYHGHQILILNNKQEAKDYSKVKLDKLFIVGVFHDNNDKIIGIEIPNTTDIYSPNKLIKLFDEGERFHENEGTTTNWIDWWNTNVFDESKKEQEDYDDVELTLDELEKYFIKTMEVPEKTEDADGLFDDGKWINYYIKPYCGLSFKINNTLFNYSSQNIEKLIIFESEGNKTIYCYDHNDKWLEDIDIRTKEPYENIRFIFQYGDLKRCSTTNEELQSYVELYEQLNTYSEASENRETMIKWLDKYGKYVGVDKNE